jgi:serine protease Do
MKKIIFCLFTILFGMDTGAYCQQSVTRLEKEIVAGYKKAYPACVKLYAYDTVAKQQAGGQFSGVVVSKDGYILTAAHVDEPGKVYKATFPDGKSCIAVGLGKIELAEDKTRPDAAMLKITNGNDWPFAEVANSDDLKVNEPCLSISYPESLNQPKPTLRFGYVSEVKNERGFIRSTCVMEPGDSGGPLFDYLGRVIGIHSAIEIPEADNYDVPVNVFFKYWHALIKPVVYTSLPAVENGIPKDASVSRLITISGQNNNADFNALKSNLNNNCYFVKSVIKGKEQIVTATLFKIQGSDTRLKNTCLLISKSSLVGDSVVITGKKAKATNAVVIARDRSNDLVMLLPSAELPGGIPFQKDHPDSVAINAGSILCSPQPESSAIISISGSSVFSLPKMSNAAFLGVGFKSKAAPLKIAYIFPKLNKSIYSLNIGDEIICINKDTLTGFDDFLSRMNRYWPGDSVMLTVKQSEKIVQRTIVLDSIPQRHFDHPAEKFAGGKSLRRDGFEKVFTHDAILQPYQCGGPVFDDKGAFYGLNIARFSRTTVIVIPASVVYDFIERHLAITDQATKLN